MNCWHCERPAYGACRFCGRGVCKEHIKSMPFILAAYSEKESVKAIVVEDALFCGVCKPNDEPIDLETKGRESEL